jgi:hypothetical protein
MLGAGRRRPSGGRSSAGSCATLALTWLVAHVTIPHGLHVQPMHRLMRVANCVIYEGAGGCVADLLAGQAGDTDRVSDEETDGGRYGARCGQSS